MKKEQIQIAFPLQGVWLTKISPADIVPSHGTDRFGLRYAFDFIQVDWENPKQPSHNKSTAKYFFQGIPLKSYYCWGAPIYAPFCGEVVAAKNNMPERENATWFKDQSYIIRNSLFFNPAKDSYESLAGNYVIVKKSDNIFAAFCHLQKDSLAVSVGQTITQGQFIGNVGHSGNSTEPHLHFQLMDSDNIDVANGLPFVFEKYEKFNGDSWEMITNDIPAATDRIRFLKE